MSLLDALYPKNCLECKARGKYICDRCMQKVERGRFSCPKCKGFSYQGRTHSFCKSKYSIDGIYSLWTYQGAIKMAIGALKYRFAEEISDELARRFIDEYRKRPLAISKVILMAVPLHKNRLKWRGFNQSLEIGQVVAKNFGWELETNLIQRKEFKRPQMELRGEERKINIKGVFGLKPGQKVKAAGYVIFDDVATTGSTLGEIAKVLKRNGAKEVWGLTIAG